MKLVPKTLQTVDILNNIQNPKKQKSGKWVGSAVLLN